MSIVMFVSDEYAGYGDFLFGLKIISELKDQLKKIAYIDPIYLVTREKGKEKILALGGDQEFGVEVKTIKEFNHLREAPDFSFDYYIEGPVFDPLLHERLTIPEDIPVLLLPEYSIDEHAKLAQDRYLNSSRSQLNLIYSGFNADAQEEKETPRGIILTQALMEVAAQKNQGDFSFRKDYWGNLKKYSAQILGIQSQEEYHEATDLFFDYSHISPLYNPDSYHQNHRQHYLQIHAAFVKESNKNQDVIVVSGSSLLTVSALEALLPTLKKNGFDKIVYVTLETDYEEVLYEPTLNEQDKQTFTPKKTYRLLHVPNLTHAEMIAVLALSGDLVGVTGDQTLGEALSAKKLIVYECLSHKESLMHGIIRFFKKMPKKSYLGVLLDTITKKNIDNLTEDEQKDLHNPSVLLDYQVACERLHQQHDLFKLIMPTVKPVILYISLKKALDKHDTEASNRIFQSLFQEKNFSLLERMLAYLIEKTNQDRISIIESLALQAQHLQLSTIPRDQYPLFYHCLSNALFVEKMHKAYHSILTYQPPILGNIPLKRKKQIEFLKLIQATAANNLNHEITNQVFIGALLLIRKSILDESYFLHTSHLLKKIEAQLKLLKIDPNDEKTEQVAFWELRNHTEKYPTFWPNITFMQDFNKFSGLQFAIDYSVSIKTALDLDANHIKLYQELLQNRLEDPKKILKISKKANVLSSQKLPFSILKYPQNKGFYLLEHGKGSVLGQGGWGKVKLAYYCDEKGIISRHALAIKIEAGKNATNSAREIGFFKAAHPSQESYLYQHGLPTDSHKNYSVLPRLPGISLEAYLAENPDLTIRQRLIIVISVLKSVDELHKKGIAHLDLKPKNILFDPNKIQSYLIDFGCAEKFGDKLQFNNLEEAKFAIEYMPPEYFEDRCLVNPNLDIYSCATTFSQIMGISLADLIKEKLEDGLQVFKNINVKTSILELFHEKNSLDIALFSQPNFIYQDPNFNAFLKEFCRSDKFNFTSCRIDDLTSVLEQMVDINPDKRPSIYDIVFALIEIVKTIPDESCDLPQLKR